MGPQENNNNARLNQLRRCHMNELFQYVTTLNEEIIDNDLHHING